MEQTINLAWKEGMHFTTQINGHELHLDADTNNGGTDQGPRPKPLLLAALAGCTAMDVISILAKMKVVPEDFDIKVNANIGEEHPMQYTSMHLVYMFKGKDLPLDKLTKAIELSQEKYCGVSAMYKKFLKLTYEIQVR
ncbi:MAG: OsmC family protein [Bacteroidales bacterium]|nr:OsmC family protein [Bacteroidales bacterium]